MKQKTLQFYKAAVAAALGAGIAVSVTAGLWFLPAIMVAAGASFLWVLKKRVTEVTEDERDRKVAGRAAIAAMTVYSVGVAAIGSTLVALRSVDPLYEIVGAALLYGASALVLFYSVLFKWYVRRQDGD